MERLLAFGNRNGFTAGYYDMRNGRSMMTLTDSSHGSRQRSEGGLSGTGRDKSSGSPKSCISCGKTNAVRGSIIRK